MSDDIPIHLCYCSENLPDPCNYCLAKRSVMGILDFPPIQGGEEAINRIFDDFNIAPKTRLHILFDLGGRNDDVWFST